MSSKAIRCNGEVMQQDLKMSDIKPLHYQYWLLQRGHKQFCLVKSAK
ncbi:hypothetical protein [Rheinheimera sediminis]